MLNQAFFYDLDILSFDNFTISIRAILLLLILIVCFILRKKKSLFDKLLKITYIIIALGVLQVFIFTNTNPIMSFDIFSKLNYYLYSLLHFPLRSLNTFFMVYSHLYLITFIPFYLIFKNHKLFIKFITFRH